MPVFATMWTGRPELPFAEWDPLADDDIAPLRAAVEAGQPLWLELSLGTSEASLTDDVAAWFEGDLDVWQRMPTPIVDWNEVAPALSAIGLSPPGEHTDKDASDARFLRALPYVYHRGVIGTEADLFGDGTQLGGELTAFPAVGFEAAPADGEAFSYRVLRTIVAAIDDVAITVRLPDERCPVASAGSVRIPRAADQLKIPVRFLPLRRKPSGREMAEAIGLHQAASARALSKAVWTHLRTAEQRAREAEDGSVGSAGSFGVHADTVHLMSEVVYQAQGCTARVLRRLGEPPHGRELRERAGLRGDAAPPPLVPLQIAHRYRFAIDELASLREDCRTATEFLARKAAEAAQHQREHFQLVGTMLATLVLVPALLVGLFGADVWLPGDSRGARLVGLVALMAVVAGGSWAMLARASGRQGRELLSLRAYALSFVVVAALIVVVAALVDLIF